MKMNQEITKDLCETRRHSKMDEETGRKLGCEYLLLQLLPLFCCVAEFSVHYNTWELEGVCYDFRLDHIYVGHGILF